MIEVTAEVLDEMVGAIVEAVHPEAIVLFGSRAADLNREDSDVDLLVVETKPFGPGRSRIKEMDKIASVLARYRVAKDILVFSRADVEKWRNSLNHVIGRSMREGKVLYGRY